MSGGPDLAPDLALGLDGGGSGCRAVLADAQGRVLGRGEAGPANVHSDREGALAAIRAACDQALAGAAPGRVAAVLGLAGAEVSGARDWLTPRLPFGRAQVVQDAVIATAGALGEADGIVAAIGTGSVFARRRGPEFRIIGGRGWHLGDEAGGAWMGRRLLAGALRAADGVGPMTPLLAATLDRLGGIAGIVTLSGTARAADYAAQVAPILAAPEDPAAAAILAEAEAEIAAYVGRLRHEDAALPVAFTGGLAGVFAPRLAARFPVIAPRGTALDGALALALGLLPGAAA